LRYAIGKLEVMESAVPEVRPGGAALVRRFHMKSDQPLEGLLFRASTAESIEWEGIAPNEDRGTWKCSGRSQLHVWTSADPHQAIASGTELRIPIELVRHSTVADTNKGAVHNSWYEAELEVGYEW